MLSALLAPSLLVPPTRAGLSVAPIRAIGWHACRAPQLVASASALEDAQQAAVTERQQGLEEHPCNAERAKANKQAPLPPPTKDLKHRVICAGVERLIAEKKLDAAKVVLWCDWQSIYQDDKEEKLKGVMSLIKYAALSDYMLVPKIGRASCRERV